ncbi:MAG: CCA tRNA nucleotidyltransferase, partial [Planctomycetota bacterium]
MNQHLEKTFAREVVQKLVDAGFEALWAGGCVRDELLGLVPADYDIATSARPEQVRKIFPRTVAVGASFGVIEVIGPLHPNGKPIMIQVATFRADLGYTDGRRPDAIRYCSAQEDALRRDFTINGMFFDPIANKLVDYVEGQIDLKSKVLRAIGDANVRFAEDRLRMLRAARLVPRFDLKLDETTKAAILANASAIGTVSPERIADELRKIFQHPSRGVGIRLFIELGLARQIFPEVFSTETVGVYTDILAVIQHLPKVSSFPLVLASLLQKLSGKQAEETCRRFKMSNVEIEATRS